jgi:hypothetical protein
MNRDDRCFEETVRDQGHRTHGNHILFYIYFFRPVSLFLVVTFSLFLLCALVTARNEIEQ